MPTPAQTDPTAVTGRRVLAAIIDWLIIAVPTFLLLTASFEYIENPPAGFCDRFMDAGSGACVELGDRAYFTRDVSINVSLLGFGLTIGLLVVLQGLTGFTPGKLVAGIRNVREDGRAPGILKAFVRWLLWIVDGFPYVLPLVGFITAVSTPGHRRLGDMAAKTFVVRSSAMGSPVHVPGLTAPPTAAYAGAPGGWDAPPPPGGTWGPPAAPPATPPATSSDPTVVGWGGPAPSPGEPPSAPAWPTPGATTTGAPATPGPPAGPAPAEAPSAPADPDVTVAAPQPQDEGAGWAAGAATTPAAPGTEAPPHDGPEPPPHAAVQPGPEPDSQPTPASEPEPQPQPEPEPEPAPQPQPEPEPAPAVGPDATVTDGPVHDSTTVAPAAAPPPQWDEARGTYIQWDPGQGKWLQWDEPAQSWVVIPGQ